LRHNFNTRIERYGSGFYDASGVWKKTSSVIYSDAQFGLGDIVRCSCTDYRVMKISEYQDLSGTAELYSYIVS
jgi:hypothetical protein